MKRQKSLYGTALPPSPVSCPDMPHLAFYILGTLNKLFAASQHMIYITLCLISAWKVLSPPLHLAETPLRKPFLNLLWPGALPLG